ncbi:MAG: hypothetical protein V4719_08630 [Planctomycetota bacterium]
MSIIYRILQAPPGYPEEQQYMVVGYENLDFTSSIKSHGPQQFATTLNEARQMIPPNAGWPGLLRNLGLQEA